MKCEIARDLLALYVDDLCSQETRKELELHLKDCPECAKKLENYRKELKNEFVSGGKNAAGGETTVDENKAEAEPMKKVGKKMKKGKAKVIVLSVVLIFILGCIGILSFGEATNYGPSFTSISDMIKIKSACEKLAKGDTDAFLDLLATRMEDRYILRATGAFESEEAYKDALKKNVNDAYEYYFKGKDIKVKFSEIGLVPYGEIESSDEYASYISVEFYDGDTVVRHMQFAKVSKDSFTVFEDNGEVTHDHLAPSFTDAVIPYDEIVLKIVMPYAAQSTYKKLKNGEDGEDVSTGGGLFLIIHKSEDEADEEFAKQMKERLGQLVDRGCYIKNITYNLDAYDEKLNKWIYKVWITFEDQHNGAVFVTEQRFLSHNDRLYVMEEENAFLSSVSAGEDGVYAENLELALGLFK